MIEVVARALAVDQGEAKGNCDCRRCMDGIARNRRRAEVALAAIAKGTRHEG